MGVPISDVSHPPVPFLILIGECALTTIVILVGLFLLWRQGRWLSRLGVLVVAGAVLWGFAITHYVREAGVTWQADVWDPLPTWLVLFAWYGISLVGVGLLWRCCRGRRAIANGGHD